MSRKRAAARPAAADKGADGTERVLVDARGLRCPIPVIRIARAAALAPPGTELELWATDPAAEPDVRAWARMRGHEVASVGPLPRVEPPRPENDDDDGHAAAVVVVVRVGAG